jgi:hypothetical protein
VYRIKLRFHDALTEAALGPDTGKFFVMTRGTSTLPSTLGQNARYHMVTTAFTEMVDSDQGKVGYRGTVDINGTRYTDPSYPTWGVFDDVGWCDWFYWWVGNHLPAGFVHGFFADMNPDGVAYSFKDPTYDGCGTEIGDLDGDGIRSEQLEPGSTGIGWVDSACETYDGDVLTTANVLLAGDRQLYTLVPGTPYYNASESQHAARNPGDFILFGWTGGGGHVGMVLGYYPGGDGTVVGNAGAGGTVYYIAGNEGNKVNVNAIVGTTTEIKQYGKLLPANFQ